MKKVLVPIANGSEEMEAVIIIDILRRAELQVEVVSDDEIVTCSRGVKILPDKKFDDLNSTEIYDAIVLPGGLQGVENFIANEKLASILKNHKNNNALVSAICAAPKALKHINILENGQDITSHPSIQNIFTTYNYKDDKFVFSNNILTSRGAGTAIDFALKLVEILVGTEKSNEIKKAIVYQ